MVRLHGTQRWRRRSLRQRKEQVLCERCLARGRVRTAHAAHHVVRHENDPEIFWSSPLESLCEECHNSEAQQQEKKGFSRTIGTDGWPLDPMHPANRC
jgi:5-methylcytosine-specific restriction enzyme A